MNSDLKNIAGFCKDYGFMLNIDKTKLIVFDSKKRMGIALKHLNLKLKGFVLTFSDTVENFVLTFIID